MICQNQLKVLSVGGWQAGWARLQGQKRSRCSYCASCWPALVFFDIVVNAYRHFISQVFRGAPTCQERLNSPTCQPPNPSPPPPPPRTPLSPGLLVLLGVHAFCHNITSARFAPVSYLWIQQEPPSRKACRCLAWHRWVPTSRAPLSGWQGGPAATTQVAFYRGSRTECSDWVLLFTSTGE